MRVLVTGAAGYLGSVLCPALLREGYHVIALDSFRYGPQQATALAACCGDIGFELVRGDVRDSRTVREAIKGCDAVVPLAAIVGAPACVRDPLTADDTNHNAILRMVRYWLSDDQLVVYPNTNSGYGSMSPGSNAPLDEDAPLTPISLYGRVKCGGERAALQEHGRSVVFRLATVFGASPRMRTDLLVNDFVLRAHRDRAVTLFDPGARRNYVHVRDVVDAFVWAIDRQDAAISAGRVFNLGHDGSNCTKEELCLRIKERVPEFEWYVGAGEDPDKRDYLISNERLRRAGFEATRPLDDGIVELLKLYRGFPETVWGNV